MSNSLIRVNGLSKSYKRKAVLKDLDFELTQGSVTGLLGKNGAGKSTFLKCVLGLLNSDAGEVKIFDENCITMSGDAKARIGYVPQEMDFFSWMTVGQILNYTAAFYPAWNRHFIKETAQSWDLDLDDDVTDLSRGQSQKLAILLALGHEPELLILDEPAASLDPAARRDFLGTLLELVSELGQTILFSTHITSDIERIANRVALLKDGKILLHQDLDDLKDSVKRIRLIGDTDLPRTLKIPEALYTRVRGKEAVFSVTHCDENFLQRIEHQWQAKAQVQDLNLEDIFLELHHD